MDSKWRRNPSQHQVSNNYIGLLFRSIDLTIHRVTLTRVLVAVYEFVIRILVCMKIHLDCVVSVVYDAVMMNQQVLWSDQM